MSVCQCGQVSCSICRHNYAANIKIGTPVGRLPDDTCAICISLRQQLADTQADVDGMKQNWADAKKERDRLRAELKAVTESPTARCHIAGHRDEIERLREALDMCKVELEAWKEAAEEEGISVRIAQAAHDPLGDECACGHVRGGHGNSTGVCFGRHCKCKAFNANSASISSEEK